MSSRPLKCPNCGLPNIEQHDASGASVCTDCGVVIEENAIVSAVEFVEGAGGASSMVGQFVSATSSKAFSSGAGGGRGGRYGFSRDSRETTLANGRRRIQEVASRLRLGSRYVDTAHRLFTIAVERNFVQGRRTTHVVAACLYIACRQEKSQHMLIDFSDALQVNVYTLGTCFLKFRRLLGLKLEIIDPALYIYRFAAHLDLDDKANSVALTALRLVGRMKRDWIVTGRRPAGICAAALLIAARVHGFSKHPQDVTRILRVCGLTVTSRVREFEHTPSASLTLEQFNQVELDIEADPPIFTKNRILEARAKAIQEMDVDLLNSGALDDPLSGGKRATKWRMKKFDEKAQQFQKLYEKLEKEIINQSQSSSTTDIATTDEKIPTAAADATTKEAPLEGAKKEEPEAVAEKEKPTTTKIVEKEELNKEEEDSKCPPMKPSAMVIKPTALSATETSTEILKKIDPDWIEAYPKSKFGKAIILPTHATPEERLPSTIPVEAKLDLKLWKQDMPIEIAEDVESMFRTEAEMAQKEAIFNKINKDYLVLQQQKEKDKESMIESQSQRDLELEEQAEGHERYRRRKQRGRNGGTTEEALMEAVANRKISRKINYDAMSAIFDEDGSFSTEAAAEASAEGDVPMIEL